jgi:hypothetical protein
MDRCGDFGCTLNYSVSHYGTIFTCANIFSKIPSYRSSRIIKKKKKKLLTKFHTHSFSVYDQAIYFSYLPLFTP